MLESLRESRPNDRTLLNNLSIAYQRSGRPGRAIDVVAGRAWPPIPDHALFHFNIASLFEEAGQPASAVEHFARAAELDPGLPAAHERLAMLLMRQGQSEAARESLEAMVPLGGASSAFQPRGDDRGVRWALVERHRTPGTRGANSIRHFTRGHVFLGRAFAEAGHLRRGPRGVGPRAHELGTHPDDVAAARDRLAELDTDAS